MSRTKIAPFVTDVWRPMQPVTHGDYLRFLSSTASVRIGGTQITLRGKCEGCLDGHVPGYVSEQSTIWAFPSRGAWVTHKGDYPGNWSPYVPRNLIERFTTGGELVLDPMMGSGTTLVECKLLGRNALGVDINRDAVMLAHDRLNFETAGRPPGAIRLFWGDARKLNEVGSSSIDLVATHPPYANIINYGGTRFGGDLSNLASISDYLDAMREIATECLRVLNDGRHCAILIGDTRIHGHYVPISHMVMTQFMAAGFVLKEEIIKVQHNTTSGRGRWSEPVHGFYKIAHEHLFVFRKPRGPEERKTLSLSSGMIEPHGTATCDSRS